MKKLIAMFMALLVLVSLCACAAPKTDAPQTSGDDTQPLKTITVTVVRKDGTSKDYTYQTAEEFVGPVLEKDGLIEGNMGPYGMEITKVEGVQAIYTEDKAYWAVYEGEEYATTSAAGIVLVDGGVYKLIYERF